MYTLKVDDKYFVGKGLLWSNKLQDAAIYDLKTATEITNHFKKYNVILTGVECNQVEIHKYV